MSRHDYSHLSIDERRTIQLGIENGSTKATIGKTIGKDATTVAKEIQKHRILRPRNISANPVVCKHRKSCKLRKGKSCSLHCPEYSIEQCKRRDRSPGACNGCKNTRPCLIDKFYYDAQQAHNTYREDLVSFREGVNLNATRVAEIEAVIAPLIKQGHSPYVIIHNHPELGITEKTLYNYIEARLFQSILDLDLYKKASRKHLTKPAKLKERKDNKHYIGRSYEDYKRFQLENPGIHCRQMDSVEGTKGGKTLHTIHFVQEHFMIAFLCPTMEARYPVENIDYLNRVLGDQIFIRQFPLILTDRGSEFSNPAAMEINQNEIRRTNIFYADPQHSWHKAEIETNHRYIRMILPKGYSFDYLTQADVNLIFSHINSSPREEINGRTPYQYMEFLYGKELLDALNIQEIPSDNVILKPYLLKKANS